MPAAPIGAESESLQVVVQQKSRVIARLSLFDMFARHILAVAR
jgi:hypothetical protein